MLRSPLGSRRRLLAATLTLTLLLSAAQLPDLVQADDGAAVNCDVDANLLGLDGEEQAMFVLLNDYRAQYGLEAVQFSPTLQRVALWKGSDMATNHYAEHDDRFRSWEQRFRDCGYDPEYGYIAENLAGGFASAAQTLQQWQGSAEHNVHLLDPQMIVAGIVRVASSDANGWYWAMELGSVAGW